MALTVPGAWIQRPSIAAHWDTQPSAKISVYLCPCVVLCELTSSCKIWRSHGGDYEEWRVLGYKNPVHTSQETHYVSAT
jgi:hypothetical protein